MQRDMDTLTPLDARNSLLMERQKQEGSTTFSMSNTVSDRKVSLSRDESPHRYSSNAGNPYSSLSTAGHGFHQPLTPNVPYSQDPDRENLVAHAAPISRQQPTVPDVGGYRNSFTQGGYGAYRGGY
jgi:hypothetical protein